MVVGEEVGLRSIKSISRNATTSQIARMAAGALADKTNEQWHSASLGGHFYYILFCCLEICPKKENYKLLDHIFKKRQIHILMHNITRHNITMHCEYVCSTPCMSGYVLRWATALTDNLTHLLNKACGRVKLYCHFFTSPEVLEMY